MEDGKYGAEDPSTGHWNGLIGEIIRGETDLVAAPVSIIASREKVVDFTAAFLADGTGILMKKPSSDEDRFIRVFKPFEYLVWYGIVIFLVGVGLLMFSIMYFSPNSEGHREDMLQKFFDGMFYSYSAYMEQGKDIKKCCPIY